MALAVILLTLAQKLPENYGGMKVNNLIGVVEDWGTGAVIAAAKVAGHLGRPFELQYESWETREHCRTIGSQRMLRQAIDLFNEEKLELDAKPFKVGGTEASREAPSMERALQDIRAKLTYLSVTNSAGLVPPTEDMLKETMGLKSLSPDLLELMQKTKTVAASLAPLASKSLPAWTLADDLCAYEVEGSYQETLGDKHSSVCGVKKDGLRTLAIGPASSGVCTTVDLPAGIAFGRTGALQVQTDPVDDQPCGRFKLAKGSLLLLTSDGDEAQPRSIAAILAEKRIELASISNPQMLYGHKCVLSTSGTFSLSELTSLYALGSWGPPFSREVSGNWLLRTEGTTAFEVVPIYSWSSEAAGRVGDVPAKYHLQPSNNTCLLRLQLTRAIVIPEGKFLIFQ